MVPKDKKAYYLFSPWLRTFHWIMALCVFVLFATGLYIGDPGFSGFVGREPTFAVTGWFSMETIRRIHFFAGFVLIASFILRIYGAWLCKGDRLLPRFNQKMFWTGIVATFKHYLFIPVEKEPVYLRNSLARLSYLIIYCLFFAEILTGLAMFSMVHPTSWLAMIFNPVNLLFGEYGVHLIHHYAAWGFILFAIAHIYLGFRADYMEANGEISSMISGSKYYEEDPEDVGDIK